MRVVCGNSRCASAAMEIQVSDSTRIGELASLLRSYDYTVVEGGGTTLYVDVPAGQRGATRILGTAELALGVGGDQRNAQLVGLAAGEKRPTRELLDELALLGQLFLDGGVDVPPDDDEGSTALESLADVGRNLVGHRCRRSEK